MIVSAVYKNKKWKCFEKLKLYKKTKAEMIFTARRRYA